MPDPRWPALPLPELASGETRSIEALVLQLGAPAVLRSVLSALTPQQRNAMVDDDYRVHASLVFVIDALTRQADAYDETENRNA